MKPSPCPQRLQVQCGPVYTQLTRAGMREMLLLHAPKGHGNSDGKTNPSHEDIKRGPRGGQWELGRAL